MVRSITQKHATGAIAKVNLPEKGGSTSFGIRREDYPFFHIFIQLRIVCVCCNSFVSSSRKINTSAAEIGNRNAPYRKAISLYGFGERFADAEYGSEEPNSPVISRFFIF